MLSKKNSRSIFDPLPIDNLAARADLKEAQPHGQHYKLGRQKYVGSLKKMSKNPLSFLGLRRRGEESPENTENLEESPRTSKGGLELNRRGVPARKRKLNSLIYGIDDLVSIPVKSPKKRNKNSSTPSKNEQIDVENDLDPEDLDPLSLSPSLNSSPTKAKKRPQTGKKTPKSIKKALELKSQETKNEPFDPELSSPEKKSAQRLGVALRNLLKLPKGHKWVCYEFFYSNLDQVLFEGENDFMVCLKESFPQLKTRRLTRVEWCKVRRLMGKPRRCSSAFFAEERAELARKRHKIRMLQQRKHLMDYSTFKDLPEQIPLLLTIGARVTGRLRQPQDGLFMGTVDAYDTSNNTYRIRFDRETLGTLSVPDEDVVSAGDLETLPLSTFTVPKARPARPVEPESPAKNSVQMMTSFSPQVQANDPLLSGRSPRGKVTN